MGELVVDAWRRTAPKRAVNLKLRQRAIEVILSEAGLSIGASGRFPSVTSFVERP